MALLTYIRIKLHLHEKYYYLKRHSRLTSFACWAFTGSPYWSKAWNWLFFVNVIIFNTAPNLENICWNSRSKHYLLYYLFNVYVQVCKLNSTYLVKNVKCYRVVHIVNDYSQHWTLGWSHCTLTNCGATKRSVCCLDGCHSLKNCLSTLKIKRKSSWKIHHNLHFAM